MHVDDLPEDIPQERFVWVTTTNRYLVDVEEMIRILSDLPPTKLTKGLQHIAYDIEQVSSRGGEPIGICPNGHVITKEEADSNDCGWCQAAAEEWAERRMDR